MGDTPKPPAGGPLLHFRVGVPFPRWERTKVRVKCPKAPTKGLRPSAHPRPPGGKPSRTSLRQAQNGGTSPLPDAIPAEMHRARPNRRARKYLNPDRARTPDPQTVETPAGDQTSPSTVRCLPARSDPIRPQTSPWAPSPTGCHTSSLLSDSRQHGGPSVGHPTPHRTCHRWRSRQVCHARCCWPHAICL